MRYVGSKATLTKDKGSGLAFYATKQYCIVHSSLWDRKKYHQCAKAYGLDINGIKPDTCQEGTDENV